MGLLVSVIIEKTSPPSIANVKIDPRMVRTYTPLKYPSQLVKKLPFTIYSKGYTVAAKLESFLDGKPLEGCKLNVLGKTAETKSDGVSSTIIIGSFGEVKFTIDIPEIAKLIDKRLVEIKRELPAGIRMKTLSISESIGISPEITLEAIISSPGRITMLFSVEVSPEILWLIFHHDMEKSGKTKVTNGVIYIGSNDANLYALNSDGSLRWKYLVEGAYGYIDASPAVDDVHVIYIGQKSPPYYFYAINNDATLKWKYASNTDFYCGVAIDLKQETIYAINYYGIVYAFNKNGGLKWTYDAGSYVYESNPTIDSDSVVYFGNSASYLYALNPNGTMKWRYVAGGAIVHGPSVSDDTIYFGSLDYNLYALNKNGTMKWKYLTGGAVRCDPAIDDDGIIYFGSDDGYVYALNPDGTLKWRYATGNYIWPTPAIGANKTIYAGSADHYLYALNPDGTLKWRYLTGDEIGGGPVVDGNEVIYFASWDYYLYALDENGGFQWKHSLNAGTWSSPAIVKKP